jgi:hypothetical protein
MIAAIRPDSWNFPLFLHVLGAMTLVGGMGTLVILSASAGRLTDKALLARNAFFVTLILVLPSWVLMRFAGEWIRSKEGFGGDDDPDWLGVGYIVGDLGLVVLLLVTGFAFWWSRRRGEGWQRLVVLVLSSIYLAALAVAWWSMAGKPGS